MKRLLRCAVLVLGLAACAPAPSAEGPVVLRYASLYPPTHPFSQADIAWISHVEEQAHGRLKIKPYWGGTLISNEHAVLELAHGVADIALVTPIYSRAGMKAIKAQAGFYEGARTPNEQVQVYKCLSQAFPVLTEEMAGVRVLAIQGGNLLNVLTRDRQVARIEDLRGLRLRTPSEVAPLLKQVGADPVTMPMAEVYSALSKGVVDGVVAPADTLRSLHFSEVARYLNLLVVPRGAYPARAISDKAWATLPPDLQAILRDAQPFWEAQLEAKITQAEAVGLEFGRTHGQVFVDVAPDEQARLDKLYNEVSLANAGNVARGRIDGVKMFNTAQAVIDNMHAGRKPC